VKAILLSGEKVVDIEMSAITKKRVLVRFLSDMPVNVDPDDTDPNIWYFDVNGNEYQCNTSNLRRLDGRRWGDAPTITLDNGKGIVREGSKIRIKRVNADDRRVPVYLDGSVVVVTKIHVRPEEYIIIGNPGKQGVYSVKPDNVVEVVG
jgi:hypothetical protein